MNCCGETLLLHPGLAVYWPAQHCLIAADVHLGKEHVFGRQGIAIPGGISESTLSKLFALSDEAGASSIIVLGDFLHAIPHKQEAWLSMLSQELEKRPALSFQVVAGNHDKPLGQAIVDHRVQWETEALLLGPFVLQHEPGDDQRGYVLSGHLHPAWRLSASRRSSIRMPAFWFRKHCAILPAFGDFTGGAIVKPAASSDSLYVSTKEAVVQVPVTQRLR